MINTGGKQQVKIEQLQQRIAELEGILKAHQIRPQGKSWSADMYALQAENERLDAALRTQEEVIKSCNEVMTNEGLKTRQEQQARIAELEQVIEIIADTSSSVDTRDIAEDALNRIRGNDE
jgi:hypothetical protein